MTAEEYLNLGDIDNALTELQNQVKAQPAKVENRVFLFQLLSVLGQWDRALTQLNVAGELDDATLAMVSMYRQVIACEQIREDVFKGIREPVIFGHPEEWVALILQSLKLTAQGNFAESQELRGKAFDRAPSIIGKINSENFEWLADSDPRLGPIMEAMIDGRYFWIPFERIKSITIDPPVDLRDMIWLPAHFIWKNGGETFGVIPTRYPDSYKADDPLLALSRKTEWTDCGDDIYLGYGQKILITDLSEYPLMDIREIHFNNEGDTGTGTLEANTVE